MCADLVAFSLFPTVFGVLLGFLLRFFSCLLHLHHCSFQWLFGGRRSEEPLRNAASDLPASILGVV